MSWREYQTKLAKPSRDVDPKRVRHLALFLGVAFALFLSIQLLSLRQSPGPTVVPEAKPQGDLRRGEILSSIDSALLDAGPTELKRARGTDDLTVDLTFDEGLQEFLTRKLEKNRVDWAGVAVVDARTGEVLALASHSEKEPHSSNLALRATYPAASIFKLVTAAAAVEDGRFSRFSELRHDGNIYDIFRRDLLRDSGRHLMTLGEALARSANVIFAKLSRRGIGGETLEAHALKFGFNDSIPFDLPMGMSRAQMPRDDYFQEARAAAGFGEVTLSPLHGALIAAAAVNGGRLMEPFIVRRVTDQKGKLRYAARPQVWKEAMAPATARELTSMMAETVTHGTARRWFQRSASKSPLRKLSLGGKTGSLSGKSPPGKNEWYVGYARGMGRELAIGAVIVSDQVWRIKPAELAREVFEFYFSPRPVLEANAAVPASFGP